MSEQQPPLFHPAGPPAAPEAAPAPHAAAAEPLFGPEVSLNAALAAWLEHLAREGMSRHTLEAFGRDMRLLAKFAGAGTAVGTFTTRGLNDYLHWMRTGRGVPCSPKTYARRVTSLKSFFRWLTAVGALSADPAAGIIQQTVQSPLPEILYDEEVKRALAAALEMRHHPDKPDPRPYVLFTLLLQTGIKKGECLALNPNHVDLSDPLEPVLYVRYTNPRQRYKERKLRLAPEWMPAFKEYLTMYSPETRLFPWSPRRLEYMLEEIGKRAALDKHISFDMCRWTCAVQDRKAGMTPDQVRQKLGLSKIQWKEIGEKLEKLASQAL